MSEPQLIFTPSGPEILVFNLSDGTLVKQLKPPQAKKINALVQRPNRPELYSASVDGKIIAWMPEALEVGEKGDNEEEEKTNVLDTIYRNLTTTPITFV